MILEAKPKRVRFRIKSGEEEHNSLDSLKMNFVWNDIRPLFDGRLKKWLRTIDANSIAEEIESLGQPEDTVSDLLWVYNTLFRASLSNPYNSIEDVLKEVLSSQRDSKIAALNLTHQILPMLSVDALIDLVYEYDNMRDIFNPYIEKHVKSINEEASADTLYKLGKLLCSENMGDEAGLNLIVLASDKNLEEANDFIEQNFPWLGKGRAKWLAKLYQDPQICKQIYESWGGKSIDPRKAHYLKAVDIDKEIKALYDFSDICLKIYKRFKSNPIISECYEISEKDFGKIDEKDPLYEEKMFVLSLFDSDDDRWESRLKRICHYPPAESMLKISHFDIDEVRFRLPVYGNQNANLLKYFILNLPKFRGVEVGVQDNIEKEVKVNRKISTSEISKVLNNKTFLERAIQYWGTKTEMPNLNVSDAENEVVNFINGCIRIAKSKDPYETAVNLFDPVGDNKMQCASIGNNGNSGLSKEDPFYCEKKFIMAIFDKFFDRARRNLNDIKDTFGAAKAMLNTPDKKVTIGGHTYQLQLYVTTSINIQGLQFFSTNILKFRNYGK